MADITPKDPADSTAVNDQNTLQTPDINSAPAATDSEIHDTITEEPAGDNDHFEALKEKYSLPATSPSVNSRKKLKLSAPVIIGLSVVILSVLGALMIWSRHEDPVQEASPVVVSERVEDMGLTASLIEGTVEVSNSETTAEEASFTELTQASRLRNGQFFRTGETGRAILTLSDGSAIRLDKNTTIQINSLTVEDVQLTLTAGRTYTRVTSNPSRNFQVITSIDSYKSIGTAYLTATADNSDIVQVFQGTVRTTESEQILEGEALTKSADSSDKTELSIKDINADEFILWNRSQDNSIDEFKEALGFLADLKAPELSVVSPADKLETKETEIAVTGVAAKDATLKINNIVVELAADGAFSYQLPLNEGKNIIEFLVIAPSGNETKATREVTRTVEKDEDEAPAITLVGETGTNGIDLAWTVLSDTVTTGVFKVVYNTAGEPEYPADSSQSTDDEGTVLPRKDGKTYKIRVCVYNQTEDTCADYSNEISVKAPAAS